MDRDLTENKKIRCSYEGCWRSTTQPYTDGWAHLSDWGPHVKDGFYCPAHSEALEAVLLEGGLDE